MQAPPITVLTDQDAEAMPSGVDKIIGLELEILGRQLHFRLCATNTRARLPDIVPAARTLSRMITDVVLENVQRNGGHIPCKRGCTHCCRSIIPLAVPEMLFLAESIQRMAHPRCKALQRSFLVAARRLLRKPPPAAFLTHQVSDSSERSNELELISTWYQSLKLDCPLNSQGICAIYRYRPLACREHFVYGAAEGCTAGSSAAEVVDIPIRMVDALVHLSADLEENKPEAIMMPLLFVWYERNACRARQSWPAAVVAECLAGILKTMASEYSLAATAPEG